MNLPGAASKGPLFVASNLSLPRVSPSKEIDGIVALRVPGFLTPDNFYRFNWMELLGTALSRYPEHLANASAVLFREIPVCPRKFAVRAFAASLVIHFLAYACFPLVAYRFLSVASSQPDLISRDNNIVYYHLKKPDVRGRIPKILAPGPGSIPGAGADPERVPAKGATKALAALFAVSRPQVPDNSHQTILQTNSPPELRIKTDLKLPNMVLAKPSVPKAPLQFNAKNVRPVQPAERHSSDSAPALAVSDTVNPVTGLLTSSRSNPRLAVPIGAARAPLMPSPHGEMLGDATAPQIEANGGTGEGLLILGTNPQGSAETVALPKGNRFGEFSIAPGGNGTGSPGGHEVGELHGAGTGGEGSGGNGSSGIGRGAHGGGGSAGSQGTLSMRGVEGVDGRLGDPGPDPIANMVYALPSSIGIRHNALVVSAGPMGGGGLDVYGALPCGKIYTIFLITSGKKWSLQYCQKSEPLRQSANAAQSPTVHTDLPITPPEAEEKFDFTRLPLPPEKAHKMIVLRGEIGEDGKVAKVEIYRGLSPEMDAAARRAFSQWKFKPAMRSGEPVSVQILLGIPAEGRKVPPEN
jgi:hypothetical protein